GLAQVGGLRGSVDLGPAGGVRVRLVRQVIPVLGDFAVPAKAENVKGHLLAGPGKVIDRVQEDLVPVLKGPDIVDSGFHRGGGQVGHGAHKGVPAGAVGEIVLDVPLG